MLGAAIGIVLPLTGWIGFTVAAGGLVLVGALMLWTERRPRLQGRRSAQRPRFVKDGVGWK